MCLNKFFLYTPQKNKIDFSSTNISLTTKKKSIMAAATVAHDQQYLFESQEVNDFFANMTPEARFLVVKHMSTCFCNSMPREVKVVAEQWLNAHFLAVVDVLPSINDFANAVKSGKKSAAQILVVCKWAYFFKAMLYNVPFSVASCDEPQELDTLAGVISLIDGDEDTVTLAVCAMTNLLDSVHGSGDKMFYIEDHCIIFKRLHSTIKAHKGNSFIVMNSFNALTSMAVFQNTDTETQTICCVFSHLTKMFGLACSLLEQQQYFGVVNNIFRFLGVTLQMAKNFPVLSFTEMAVFHYKENFVVLCINHMYNAKAFLAKVPLQHIDMVVSKKIITSICMVLGELPPLAITTSNMDILTTLFYEVRQVMGDKKISYWVFRVLNNAPSFAPKLQQQTLKLLLCMLVMRLKNPHKASFFEGLRALSSFLHKVPSINQQAYDQISFLLAQDKKGEEGDDKDAQKQGLHVIIECRLAHMKLTGGIISSAIVLHKHNLHCDVCLQKYHLRLHCSQCKLAKYCSAACQKTHWFQQDHKTWCNTLTF